MTLLYGSCIHRIPDAPGAFIHFTPARHRTRHVVHGLSLAWLTLALTTAVFAYQAASSATSKLLHEDKTLSYAPDASVPTDLSDQALAEALKPELRFTPAEPWHPTSVDWYLAHKHDQQPYPLNPRARKPRIACPHTCYALPCDDLAGSCARDPAEKPLMYALINRDAKGSLPGQYSDVATIVQYWLFYNYDALPRWLFAQWHQSDWEQITIGLTENNHPRFVGYSQHCFGSWLPWPRVAVADATHPLVYVAEGTHANYPRPFEAPLRGSRCTNLTPPRYFGAAGLAISLLEPGGRLEITGDYAFGETDHTGNEPAQIPVKVIAPTDPIASFPGTWALDNRYALAGGKGARLGDGPASPANHPEWQTPATAILCNRAWFTPKRPDCRTNRKRNQ